MERAKFVVKPLYQKQIKALLEQNWSWQEKSEQNCLYRLDRTTSQGWIRIKQFTNGTFYLEATDLEAFQSTLSLIQPMTGEAKGPIPAKENPKPVSSNQPRGWIDIQEPYIGTDESGKGDYFGPLVIAGVYATPEMALELEKLGVKDSKLLKDQKIHTIAKDIKAVVGDAGWSVIEIGPSRYNELYQSFKQRGKNLNHLLAWGHAKVLETLLAKHPNCAYAIADQFGSEHYIQSQLQTLGRQVKLYQTPKAEANTGVAAASIIARERFVQKLQALGTQCGITLPPGAGSQVIEAGHRVLRQYGQDRLAQVAKLHFKTTETLLLSPS